MITYKQLIEGITKPVPMASIIKTMISARSKIVGKSITPPNLAKAIQKAVGKTYGVEVTVKYSASLNSGDMSANAYYDQEADLEGDKALEVELLCSPEDKKGMNIDAAGFDELSSHIAKLISHELLHKSQAVSRGFVKPRPFKVSGIIDPKIAKSQEYLGSSDEIEAYGHNIAVELLRNYGSRKNALTALRNFIRIPPDKSPDMWAYIVAFAADKNHPVLKKLVKKVILFLKKLEK